MSSKRLTREEFASLKPGDVLRWYSRDGTYTLRTVITAQGRANGGITLPIRHRSWTGRCHVVYFFNDIRYKCQLHAKKQDRLMSDAELLRLCEAGFDIPKALHSEREPFGSFQDVHSAKLSAAAALDTSLAIPANPKIGIK